MSDVVISSPGTYLTLRRNRLYISRENEILSEIPIETIDRIKIIDNSRISKSVIDGCIERNIDIVFFDRCGRFYNIKRYGSDIKKQSKSTII